MSWIEKKLLLDKLTETHLSVLDTLENVDLETPIYKDSSWRVREIVGHIATWEIEATRSLRAYKAGSEYFIPDFDEDETGYNARAVLEQQKLSSQQIMDEFEQTYEELKTAVEEMPVDLFPGDMLYPWGDERGTIAQLVEFMIEHAVEHRDEIAKAMQES